MINIKAYLFYAALAACLGTGYGAHYFVSQNDRPPLDLRAIECEDYQNDEALRKLKTPRDISPSGKGF
jgi:hypothetical protein